MLKQYKDFNAKHPFKTFITDPAYDGRFNGVTGAIMQSDENKEKILEYAKLLVQEYGAYREEAVHMALDYYNLSLKSDFTDLDAKKIRDWTEGL